MGIITYNGISNKDLGLIVQYIPSHDFPEKNITYENIPGKNGDFIKDSKNFQNVKRVYSFAKVFKPGEPIDKSLNSIIEWLFSADTYVRLEDSYEPDYYRMAIFKNEGNLPNFYNEVSVFEVSFDCKPQCWLKSGDRPISISSVAINLNNPTMFNSSPIIEFDATSNTDITITVGTNTMRLNIPNNDHVIIDCENMECYSLTQNYNKYLKLLSNAFPVLNKKTATSVAITNATNAIIKPRWWTL